MIEKVQRKTILGFSLLEMSVVIIIIGIILASIVGGKIFIQQGKIRATISEISTYQIAINSFQTKYKSLPGDFSMANSFWPSAINGDDNGQIEFKNLSDSYEAYNAWAHMSLANIIDTSYDGDNTTEKPELGLDIPKSVVAQSGYMLSYDYAGLVRKNVLALGIAPANSTASLILNANMLTKFAHDLDSKLDDSFPSTGALRAIEGSISPVGACVNDNSTPSNPKDDLYQLSEDNYDCVIGYKID